MICLCFFFFFCELLLIIIIFFFYFHTHPNQVYASSRSFVRDGRYIFLKRERDTVFHSTSRDSRISPPHFGGFTCQRRIVNEIQASDCSSAQAMRIPIRVYKLEYFAKDVRDIAAFSLVRIYDALLLVIDPFSRL